MALGNSFGIAYHFDNVLVIFMFYSTESWTVNKNIAKRLAAFERKVLIKMFGQMKVNENWRK